MEQDSLEKLKAKKRHLEEWLRNHKSADDVAAEVQKNLDFTNWQIDALEGSPDEADEIPRPDLTQTLDSDSAYLGEVLPPMPLYDMKRVIAASAFTSSGTVPVYQYVSRVGDLGTEDSLKYSSRVTVAFQSLQQAYDRPGEIRELVAGLGNPGTLDRFDAALRSLYAYKRGTANRASPAIDMRTLIDGVKGDLCERARSHAKEDMSWETMSARLALGGEASEQHTQLRALEKTHSSLVSRLSDIAKDREAGSLTSVDNVWAEIQDYLVSLLRLVSLER
jgi:hypothetical protein